MDEDESESAGEQPEEGEDRRSGLELHGHQRDGDEIDDGESAENPGAPGQPILAFGDAKAVEGAGVEDEKFDQDRGQQASETGGGQLRGSDPGDEVGSRGQAVGRCGAKAWNNVSHGIGEGRRGAG